MKQKRKQLKIIMHWKIICFLFISVPCFSQQVKFADIATTKVYYSPTNLISDVRIGLGYPDSSSQQIIKFIFTVKNAKDIINTDTVKLQSLVDDESIFYIAGHDYDSIYFNKDGSLSYSIIFKLNRFSGLMERLHFDGIWVKLNNTWYELELGRKSFLNLFGNKPKPAPDSTKVKVP